MKAAESSQRSDAYDAPMLRDWLFERKLDLTHAWLRAARAARPRTFTLGGERFAYVNRRYNATWINERAVELALGEAFLAAAAGRRILELGNVMGHYAARAHDVVDKYEQAPGVRNVDILDVPAEAPYDAVLSLSTVEHVGQDEEPREPEKALRALDHLRALTAPGGRLLVTFPVGHNPALDEAVRDERLPFADVRYLRRVDAANRWREVAREEIVGLEYGRPFPLANGIVVCRSGGA
jgi:SAM-dependent methyltransferase